MPTHVACPLAAIGGSISPWYYIVQCSIIRYTQQFHLDFMQPSSLHTFLDTDLKIVNVILDNACHY